MILRPSCARRTVSVGHVPASLVVRQGVRPAAGPACGRARARTGDGRIGPVHPFGSLAASPGEVHGFASPPRDGFALVEDERRSRNATPGTGAATEVPTAVH